MEDNMQIRVLKMYALNDNVADTSLFWYIGTILSRKNNF